MHCASRWNWTQHSKIYVWLKGERAHLPLRARFVQAEVGSVGGHEQSLRVLHPNIANGPNQHWKEQQQRHHVCFDHQRRHLAPGVRQLHLLGRHRNVETRNLTSTKPSSSPQPRTWLSLQGWRDVLTRRWAQHHTTQGSRTTVSAIMTSPQRDVWIENERLLNCMYHVLVVTLAPKPWLGTSMASAPNIERGKRCMYEWRSTHRYWHQHEIRSRDLGWVQTVLISSAWRKNSTADNLVEYVPVNRSRSLRQGHLLYSSCEAELASGAHHHISCKWGCSTWRSHISAGRGALSSSTGSSFLTLARGHWTATASAVVAAAQQLGFPVRWCTWMQADDWSDQPFKYGRSPWIRSFPRALSEPNSSLGLSDSAYH